MHAEVARGKGGVSGAARMLTHRPRALSDAARPGGRMVAPVEKPGRGQQMMVIDRKEDGTFKEHGILSVIFVPLQPSPPSM